METVYLQIHSTNELPLMQRHSSHGKDGNAIPLKAGHEYHIKVMPYLQSVTQEFIWMAPEDRGCLLSNEISLSATSKIYTKQNF